MPKKRFILAAAAGFVVGRCALYYYQCIQDIYTRFPDVDRKIARQAWHAMMLGSLCGAYKYIDLDDEHQLDVLFLLTADEIRRNQ